MKFFFTLLLLNKLLSSNVFALSTTPLGAKIERADGSVKLELYCQKSDFYNECETVVLARTDVRIQVPFTEISSTKDTLSYHQFMALKNKVGDSCPNEREKVEAALEGMGLRPQRETTQTLSYSAFTCLDFFLSLQFSREDIKNTNNPDLDKNTPSFGGIIKSKATKETIRLVCASFSDTGHCQRFHFILENAARGWAEFFRVSRRSDLNCGHKCYRLSEKPVTYRQLSLIADSVRYETYHQSRGPANQALFHLTSRINLNQTKSFSYWHFRSLAEAVHCRVYENVWGRVH